MNSSSFFFLGLTSKRKEQLSEVQIMQMRLQVQHQRFKVEEER